MPGAQDLAIMLKQRSVKQCSKPLPLLAQRPPGVRPDQLPHVRCVYPCASCLDLVLLCLIAVASVETEIRRKSCKQCEHIFACIDRHMICQITLKQLTSTVAVT